MKTPIHLRFRHLPNRKVLAGVLLVVALLAIALWPASVPVDTATVARGTIRVTVDEEGETRVRHRFLISAPVAGRVLRIDLEPGDPVTRDTVVATFLPAAAFPLDARSRAEAEARAAEEALRAAEFAAAGARHQLEMAEARLLPAGTTGAARPLAIKAPLDGTVFKRLRESEAVVAAGEPLLEIGDQRGLEIVSDLLSTDAVKVKPGAPVLLEHWGGDHPIKARVRRVEPSGFMKISALGVEEQRVNVVMDFDDPIEAWSTLGDGYRVEVRIVIAEAENALLVPTSGLFRSDGDWAAFAVDGSRAALRRIEIGRRNDTHAEVVSGLREGESVVLHPSDALKDGARVARRAS